LVRLEGMRVERSFAFLDLCGFTSYTAIEGDERATNVLAEFRGIIRDIASRRGVRVAKWLVDGAMIVSVEPEPLVSAVLEIERRVDDGHSALPIRAGLGQGAVIPFDGDDYIGTPVNLAARLCDAAGPREVLAVPDFCESCLPWAEAGEPYELQVAGFAGPVQVIRLVVRSPGPATVTDPVCGLVLTAEFAVRRETGNGDTQLFCSESCALAWSGSA